MKTFDGTVGKLIVNAGEFTDPEWSKFCKPIVKDDTYQIGVKARTILKTRFEREKQTKKELSLSR